MSEPSYLHWFTLVDTPMSSRHTHSHNFFVFNQSELPQLCDRQTNLFVTNGLGVPHIWAMSPKYSFMTLRNPHFCFKAHHQPSTTLDVDFHVNNYSQSKNISTLLLCSELHLISSPHKETNDKRYSELQTIEKKDVQPFNMTFLFYIFCVLNIPFSCFQCIFTLYRDFGGDFLKPQSLCPTKYFVMFNGSVINILQ